VIEPEIKNHIETDPFAKQLGIELIDLEQGYARCAMLLRADMLNFHGIGHGGAVFALADYAFSAACNSYGQTAVALNVSISFIEPVQAGIRLVGEAREESLGSRVGLYRLRVTDDRGKTVALAQATAYRKNQWFYPPASQATPEQGSNLG
jgi:acyl-CoA thioesterase